MTKTEKEQVISIPASRTEGDKTPDMDCVEIDPFQSPPPARKATTRTVQTVIAGLISIPASRTEGDRPRPSGACIWGYFNPRLPHGRRRSGTPGCGRSIRFQSPPPARKATYSRSACSIGVSQFQFPPPARKATLDVRPGQACRVISIPASRTEGDLIPTGFPLTYRKFQSPPPARKATAKYSCLLIHEYHMQIFLYFLLQSNDYSPIKNVFWWCEPIMKRMII